MIPGSFEYYAPRSFTDAVKYLSAHKDDVKILSGGQSLLPLMKMRLSKPGYIVDIGRIPGLDSITEEGNNLIIGALVTHEQIEYSDLLESEVSAAAANGDHHRRRASAQPRHHRRQHRPRRPGRRLARCRYGAGRRDSELSVPTANAGSSATTFFSDC